MKRLLITAALLLGSSAQAEVYTCIFTEPFFNLTIDSNKSTIDKTYADDEGNIITETIYAGVRVVEAKRGRYPALYVISGKDLSLIRLVQNNKGSDGMSDYVYPYEGKVFGRNSESWGDDQFGGCESSTLKRKN